MYIYTISILLLLDSLSVAEIRLGIRFHATFLKINAIYVYILLLGYTMDSGSFLILLLKLY